MPEETAYTREELEKKSRLLLRRIAKEHGMSSEDCAQAHFDDLVNWIEEQQDGETAKPARSKASKSKASKSKTSKASGKDALAAKKAGKAGKAAPKKKVTAKKPADDEGVVHADALAAIETVVEKIDELGQVYNTNNTELTEKIDELTAKVDAQAEEIFNLQAEMYKNQGVLVHGFSWLESEGILTPDGAPEELSTEDKLNALAAECEGNEEGNEEGDGE